MNDYAVEFERFDYDITLSIMQEECVANPREDFDNLGTLMIWASDADHIGDERCPIDPDYRGVERLTEYLKDVWRARFITYVRFEDYGSNGARLHTWDDLEGANGVIFITENAMKKEFGVDRTDWLAKRVPPVLEGEVEMVDQWLSGDVYWFKVERADENWLNSCGGFYGLEHCREEAMASVKHYIEEARKNEQRTDLAFLTTERKLVA